MHEPALVKKKLNKDSGNSFRYVGRNEILNAAFCDICLGQEGCGFRRDFMGDCCKVVVRAVVILISQHFLGQKRETEPQSRFLDAQSAPSTADKSIPDETLLVGSSVPLHPIPLGSYHSFILKSPLQPSSNFSLCGWRSKVCFVIYRYKET